MLAYDEITVKQWCEYMETGIMTDFMHENKDFMEIINRFVCDPSDITTALHKIEVVRPLENKVIDYLVSTQTTVYDLAANIINDLGRNLAMWLVTLFRRSLDVKFVSQFFDGPMYVHFLQSVINRFNLNNVNLPRGHTNIITLPFYIHRLVVTIDGKMFYREDEMITLTSTKGNRHVIKRKHLVDNVITKCPDIILRDVVSYLETGILTDAMASNMSTMYVLRKLTLTNIERDLYHFTTLKPKENYVSQFSGLTQKSISQLLKETIDEREV